MRIQRKEQDQLLQDCLSATIVYHNALKIEIIFILYLSITFHTRRDNLFLFF